MSPKSPSGIPTQTLNKRKGSAMGELVLFKRFRADLTTHCEDEGEMSPVFDIFNHGFDQPVHPLNQAKAQLALSAEVDHEQYEQ